MNSIPDTSSTGQLREQGHLKNAQFSGHARKQTVNAYESLDTGLTIKTREGDVVTLSSSRFSEFNASEYNSKGEIRTDSGNMLTRQHTREISLSTGELFSFSVQGDLNEQELADIEAIVMEVDSIVAQVAEGDMDQAFEKAMDMGSYSSVSMYSAQISHERSYAVTDETTSTSYGRFPGPDPASIPRETNFYGSKQMDGFVDKLAQLIGGQEEKLLSKAQQPLSELFDQFLTNKEAVDGKETPGYGVLKTMGEQLDLLINDFLKNAFDTTLNHMV